MSVYEAIIIYLALGAPFAVRHFFKNRKNRRAWLSAGYGLLFWVPLLALDLRKKAFRSDYTHEFAFNDVLDAEITDRVQKIFDRLPKKRAGGDRLDLFSGLHEVLDRYTSLTIMRISRQNLSMRDAEIFRVSGHGNEQLAAGCIARRNRRLLVSHQERAARDLISVCEMLRKQEFGFTGLNADVAAVAELLGDTKTAAAINRMSWPLEKATLKFEAFQNAQVIRDNP